jgi:flagellar hook-associated protein 1 FlgK
MNLSSVLSIGTNGLNAASHGTQVASQNISNAATPGYTRRIANFEQTELGVKAAGSTRVNDQFLEARSLGARASSGDANARVQTLTVLDTVFSDGQGSVGEALDAFDSAMSDLSMTPNSDAVRQVVLGRADDLSKAFQRTSEALAGARSDANGRITVEVSKVNEQLDQIGQLGAQIVQAKNLQQEAPDLEDRRDELIRQVASSIPVTVIPDKSGAVTMMVSGSRTLVAADNTVHHLIATPDATSGAVRIQRVTNGQLEDITDFITSGSIGGTIAARDGALKTAQDSLDQMASDLTTAYNTQHALGVGMDGNTGRNLFTPSAQVAGAAAAFSLSSDVAGHPEFLGAAQDATTLPGDNRNALALVAIRDKTIGLSGTATAQQTFTSLVAAGGAALRSANDSADHASSVQAQVDALRDSMSGVSTDEEMVSLMKFQRAYQASLKVIETADSMLSDLLNMNIGR